MAPTTDPAASASPERVVPRHVAIIMDGNGRWATRRGLPRIAGHEAGTENIRRVTTHAAELGIKYLTLWAFSTENWRRPKEEVEGILQILARSIERETAELHRNGAQLRHIGSLDGLDPDLQQAVREAIALTRNNDRIVLTLAASLAGGMAIASAPSSPPTILPAAITDPELARSDYVENCGGCHGVQGRSAPAALPETMNNTQFLREYTANLLKTAFPHMSKSVTCFHLSPLI